MYDSACTYVYISRIIECHWLILLGSHPPMLALGSVRHQGEWDDKLRQTCHSCKGYLLCKSNRHKKKAHLFEKMVANHGKPFFSPSKWRNLGRRDDIPWEIGGPMGDFQTARWLHVELAPCPTSAKDSGSTPSASNCSYRAQGTWNTCDLLRIMAKWTAKWTHIFYASLDDLYDLCHAMLPIRNGLADASASSHPKSHGFILPVLGCFGLV